MKKTFFGYDIVQVDFTIKKLKEDHQKEIDSLKEEIKDLKTKLETANAKLELFKKESQIAADTLIDAQKEAEDIKKQANLENERIISNAKEIASRIVEYSKQGAMLVESVSRDIEDISREIDGKQQVKNELNKDVVLPGSLDLDLAGVLDVCKKDFTKDFTIEKSSFKPSHSKVNLISKDDYLKAIGKGMPKKYDLSSCQKKSDYFKNSVNIDDILDFLSSPKKSAPKNDKSYLDDILNSLR